MLLLLKFIRIAKASSCIYNSFNLMETEVARSYNICRVAQPGSVQASTALPVDTVSATPTLDQWAQRPSPTSRKSMPQQVSTEGTPASQAHLLVAFVDLVVSVASRSRFQQWIRSLQATSRLKYLCHHRPLIFQILHRVYRHCRSNLVASWHRSLNARRRKIARTS